MTSNAEITALYWARELPYMTRKEWARFIYRVLIRHKDSLDYE